ncbi:2,6-beta-fructan 6-levanbiohydrolase [Bacillus subtilis]|uniref:2,6-beta-fructan 6-levanbiohydrolase n=1 Tax=Bacillus subtilis TaxID=1423 RepID=UPI00165C0D98|nr:2,6-beta-fructan 6-levanbiohydrolase [Bacillus subtilis]MCY8198442.1 2,6-beta-fructan 6-levanbiohydrolase [Bacillus subtilis]MEC1445028.1 2,6-beta-fructan 6-levanbiohydrolase [Bacillus subtilis]
MNYIKAGKWLTVFLTFLGILLFIDLFPKEGHDQKTKSKHKPDYRAAYHFTTPDKWKNDPQKPIYFDGKYHYFYLYNRDYPKGNGTEWRHAVSEDLVHWTDEGVAIPKYTNPDGDIWTGSVVVDKENTAGFGKNALVAIVTQPSAKDKKQEQYLWYSTDKGKSFKFYSGNPVMPNPGTDDFRDPKVIWDDQDNKWVMVMAEGSKIGFYESDNLKDWHYTSGFFPEQAGMVECPDLYMMRASDGTIKWVLGASANGKPWGKPNTYAYWTGSFDGKEFKADQTEAQWLDYGFDWYGGVTFEDSKSTDPLEKRYALAWMNNWDYANNTPTMKNGFNGTDSVIRELRLQEQDGTYSLVSQPIEALEQLTVSTDEIEDQDVNGSKTLSMTGDTYQLDMDLSWSELKNAGVRLRESEDQKRHIDVGIFAEGGYAYVNRAATNQPDKSNTFVESKAPYDVSKHEAHVKILVDKTTIEVFVGDGKTVFSNEVFPKPEDKGITLFSDGGTASFKNITVKHFDSVHE